MVRLTNSRLAAIGVIAVSLIMLFGGIASGANTPGTIAYRVTPGTVSITISDGSVTLGNQALSAVVTTVSGGITDQRQTLLNNGNETIVSLVAKFNTSSNEASCTSNNWQAIDSGTPGPNQFLLRVDDDGSFGDGGITITTDGFDSNEILGTNVLVDGTRAIDFELTMPESVSTAEGCTIALIFTATS